MPTTLVGPGNRHFLDIDDADKAAASRVKGAKLAVERGFLGGARNF